MVELRSAILVITAGIALWSIGLITMFVIGASADAKWICVAGIALGLFGLGYTKRRAKREAN